MSFKSLKDAWDKWRAQQQENYFKSALQHEMDTPPEVRRKLESLGYSFRCNAVTGGGGEGFCWYEVDKFKGQSVKANPALLGDYEAERKRQIYAHFKREMPSP